MEKQVYRLATARARAAQAVAQAPNGYTVTITPPRRSLDANAALWAALTEISRQAVHPTTYAQLSPEVWKALVMSAFGMEVSSVESLDGGHRVPMGLSTSELSKERFSELLEFTHALAANLGVLLHDRAAA